MKVEIDQTRLAKLSEMKVDAGRHPSYERGTCVMELAAWLRGLPITDRLECVSGPVQSFLRRYNDGLPNAPRQALLEWAPKILGSAATSEVERKRVFIAVDYAVRVFAPFWLERVGRKNDAVKLRAVKQIVDKETAQAGRLAAAYAAASAYASAYASSAASAASASAYAAYAADAAYADAAYAASLAACAASYAAYAAYADAADAAKLQPHVFKMLDEMLALQP